MAKEIKFTLDLQVNGVSSLVTVKANAEQMAKSIEEATQKTSAFKRVMKDIGEASVPLNATIQCVQQLQSSMAGLTQESNQFSAAMRAANTMAGKSGKDFENLKSQVSELSKTIPVARDVLANGLYQVVSNGVPEDNWISFLESSARSSVGGMADLGEAVKVTATVIKNYGMPWEDAAAVQDKIQLTAKNGVTSFEQLAAALPRVTGNAATLGVGIDELMASFATLTGVSGNTAEVSTQLAAIFSALVKPSSEATKMAAEMGIQFDAAAIKAAGGFQAFLTQLDASVKSYSRSSGVLEQEVYGKLFGSAESLRAMGPLTGQLAETFSRNVETMKGSAGTMDEAFETMSQGTANSLQLMKNKFGEMMDSVAGVINYAAPMLNLISTAGILALSLNSMGGAVKSLGVSLVALAQKTGIATVVQKAWNVAMGLGRSFTALLTRSVTSLATAMGIASVSARTLTWVVRGLEIATGVGAILAAVSIATDVFGNSAEKAADKVEQLSEAEQMAKQQEQQIQQTRQEAAAAMQVEIAKLKELIDSHADATKEVARLNNQYGEIFGTHKTAADWYDTLTSKSKIYCNQLVIEARMKKIAAGLADLYDLRDDFDNQYKGWLTTDPTMAQHDALGRPQLAPGWGPRGPQAQPLYETATAQMARKARQGVNAQIAVQESQMQNLAREQARNEQLENDGEPEVYPGKTTTSAGS